MLVNILNIEVIENPTHFDRPFQLEITFECVEELQCDLEWKVIYVGSAESSSFDQILEELLVGPVPLGINKFILEATAPEKKLIPSNDLLGVTVLLLACSYLDQEFIRVGYYVYNEYLPFEGYNEETHGPPPVMENIDSRHIVRRILADKPRITRFPIHWTGTESSTNLSMDENSKGAASMQIDTSNSYPNQTTNGLQHHVMNGIHKDVDMMNVSNAITSPFRSSIDTAMMYQTNAVTPEFS